jgi:hypothetical protein
MALASTQPLTEVSTRSLPGGNWRLASKADNLSASVSQLSRKCGSLDASKASGPPPLPFTRIASVLTLFAYVFKTKFIFVVSRFWLP